jgi:hypothetical protein
MHGGMSSMTALGAIGTSAGPAGMLGAAGVAGVGTVGSVLASRRGRKAVANATRAAGTGIKRAAGAPVNGLRRAGLAPAKRTRLAGKPLANGRSVTGNRQARRSAAAGARPTTAKGRGSGLVPGTARRAARAGGSAGRRAAAATPAQKGSWLSRKNAKGKGVTPQSGDRKADAGKKDSKDKKGSWLSRRNAKGKKGVTPESGGGQANAGKKDKEAGKKDKKGSLFGKFRSALTPDQATTGHSESRSQEKAAPMWSLFGGKRGKKKAESGAAVPVTRNADGTYHSGDASPIDGNAAGRTGPVWGDAVRMDTGSAATSGPVSDAPGGSNRSPLSGIGAARPVLTPTDIIMPGSTSAPLARPSAPIPAAVRAVVAGRLPGRQHRSIPSSKGNHAMRILNDSADNFANALGRADIDGGTKLSNLLKELSEWERAIATAKSHLANRIANDFPTTGNVAEAIARQASQGNRAADGWAELDSIFRRVHATEFERLENRRKNEHMWDTSHNND